MKELQSLAMNPNPASFVSDQYKNTEFRARFYFEHSFFGQLHSTCFLLRAAFFFFVFPFSLLTVSPKTKTFFSLLSTFALKWPSTENQHACRHG